MSASTTYHEPEITAPVDLCGQDGRLNRDAVGWSRQPLHTMQPAAVAGAQEEVELLGRSPATTCCSRRRSPTSSGCSSAARTSSTGARSGTSTRRVMRTAGHDRDAGDGVGGDMVIDHPAHARRADGRGRRDAHPRRGGGLRRHAARGRHPRRAAGRPRDAERRHPVDATSQFQYTSKQNTLPASGFVQLGDERLEFAAARVRLPGLRARRLAGAHGLELGRARRACRAAAPSA